MRTTLDIDDELMAMALAIAPARATKTAVIEGALRVYIERAAMRALEEAGGTLPGAQAPERRRFVGPQ